MYDCWAECDRFATAVPWLNTVYYSLTNCRHRNDTVDVFQHNANFTALDEP